MLVFLTISLAGTARSNSKALINVNSKAFVLQSPVSAIALHQELFVTNMNPETYSTSEKRYPMQALGPPLKVIMFPQMPGMLETASGIFCHLSGL
jgi:hypothetical protein